MTWPSPTRHHPDLNPLLRQAAIAYRRRDDAAFLSFLEQAHDLAPYRSDLCIDLASHHIQTGQVERAIDVLLKTVEGYPVDILPRFLLAHWYRYAVDETASQRYLLELREYAPDQAVRLCRLWDIIDRWSGTAISTAPPHVTGSVCILVLGYILEDNGTMRPALLDRLAKAVQMAERYPDAHIVVSGGVPCSGVVEAAVMRAWLVEHGLSDERIHEEGYSRDVVENMVFSRPLVNMTGADTVAVITCADNVRRSGAILETAGWHDGAGWNGIRVVAAEGETMRSFIDDGRDRLKLYRDVLRASGLPMMISYPELVER